MQETSADGEHVVAVGTKSEERSPEFLVAAGLHAATLPQDRSLRGRALEWLGEIIIVFVGVYAAFLLNAWQTQRQDRSNHLQILKALDEEVAETVESCKQGAADSQKYLDRFQQQMSAGEMPPLHLLEFSTDYDPADDVALSQAGADHLLNFKTVQALKG